MASSKRQAQQRYGDQKIFRCVGYGDCNMVFTRAEHLARHARKHTGEKPFKCVISGCGRAFSRFDNMVQHTSTHSKHPGKKRVLGKKQNKPKLVKAVTPSIDGSDTNKTNPSKTLEPLSPPMSSSSPPTSSHIVVLPVSPLLSDKDFCHQYHHHQRLPSINESLYYQSPITPSIDYFPPPFSNNHHPPFLPSPKELDLHIDSLPPLLPAISADHTSSNSYWSSSPSSPSTNSFPGTTGRKLSPMELELPIQDLSVNHGIGNVGVDVTLDEFEALQGMSQLLATILTPPTIDFGNSTSLPSTRALSCYGPMNSSPQYSV